jgi:hypothetical protein
MLSMEDLLDRNLIEEKEPLIVGSRKKLRELCAEFGITNQRMLGNQYSAIVVHLERFKKFGDQQAFECAQRIILDCQEDKHTTYL